MHVTIVEDRGVKAAGAVLAITADTKIVVIDPDLSEQERAALLRELLEE